MPYIHRGCNGEIGLWSRKCKKCGKRWPLKSLFALSPPKDMFYQVNPPQPKKGQTSYAKWADSDKAPPGVGWVASHLPNWPRWVRILAGILVIGIIVALLAWLL